MNLDSRILAIVGSNEAGKSSFLQVLEHLSGKTAFAASGPRIELSRGLTLPPEHVVIEATYSLDAKDLEKVEGIEGAKDCRTFILRKKVSGELSYELRPRPIRSVTPRKKMAAALGKVIQKIIRSENADESEYEVDFEEAVREVIDFLGSDDETLRSNEILALKGLATNFRNSGIASKIVELQKLSDDLETLALVESSTAHRDATLLLGKLVPQFRMFGNADRELNSEYSLDSLREEVPPALANLLRVAGLDLSRLLGLIDENDIGEIETIRNKANQRLKKVFGESWTQSDVSVHIACDSGSLYILVGDENGSMVQIAERSDGLRQYVALLSFVRLQQSNRATYLLIDEAETHLHYDAQADLIQMLTRQELVEKVIYTTHSVGCLPEDLGMGVRIIEKGDDGVSKINNWFWTAKEKGFSPLLFGMGAQTLAFIPVRFALIAEGPSDMILLPTLFREATKRKYLGFQVVPGLSEADCGALIKLEKSSNRTVYLTDSDEGGLEICSWLKENGIAEENIFSMPLYGDAGTITEDFINPELYVKVINEQLRLFQQNDAPFQLSDLTDNNRARCVQEWCEKMGLEAPSKRAVAYAVVEDREIFPKVDPKKCKDLEGLVRRIFKTLEDDKQNK